MEGLIVVVYKALKKKKTQKQYKCLQEEDEAATQNRIKTNRRSNRSYSYNIGDFYPEGYNYHHNVVGSTLPQMRTAPGVEDQHTSSGGAVSFVKLDDSYCSSCSTNKRTGSYSTAEDDVTKPSTKQMMMHRSWNHKFLSCVTGTSNIAPIHGHCTQQHQPHCLHLFIILPPPEEVHCIST